MRGRGNEFLSTFTQGNFNPLEIVNVKDTYSDNDLMRNEPLFYDQTNQIESSPIYSALKRRSPAFRISSSGLPDKSGYGEDRLDEQKF
jgi:hypothetical protein